MSQTVSTLAVDVIANTGGLTDGLALTKKEIREAAKIAEAATDPFSRLAAEQEKLARFARGGQLNAAQFATAMAQAEERFFPTLQEAKPKIFDAELVKTSRDFIKPINFDAMKSAKVGELAKDVTDMNKAFGLMPMSIDPGTVAMRAMTIGSVALAGAVTAVGTTVVNRMAEIDALGDAAARLGMSASSLSEIRGAAFLGDIDAATVDTMIQKMLVSVGEQKEVFGELGLDVEKLRQQSPAAMFDEIAASINAIPDKAGQMAVIAEVFGRGGAEGAALVERFGELSQAMRESGAVVSDDLASGIGETDDAMKRLTLSAEAFANTLAGISAGPIGTLLDGLTAAAKVGAFEQAAGTAVGFATGSAVLGGMASQGLLDATDANRKAAEADRVKGSNDAIDAALQHEVEATQVTADQVAKIRSQNFRKLIEDDAAFERDLQQARVRDAIRAIDEEERARKKANADAWDARMKEVDDGQKLIDSLKTPQEQTKDRLLADLDALRKSGLDNPETRDRLMRRAAGELARGETGGFGAPGADKGTRAAREAIIGSQQQEEQTSLMRRMVAELEKLVAKDELEVTEISGP